MSSLNLNWMLCKRSYHAQFLFFSLSAVRFGKKLGHGNTVDGLLKDGLWDPFNDHHMGIAAELCSEFHGISREQQDRYACESYRRASEAYDCGLMQSEIVPVSLEVKGGVKEIVEDEEYKRLIPDKVRRLSCYPYGILFDLYVAY